MAENNIGGISWVVDADTAPAINSIKGMSAQVTKAEKSLDKLDSSTDKTAGKIAILDKVTADYTAELRKNGSTISKTGIVLDKYGEVNAEATRHIQGLSNAQMKMSKTAVGVNKGLAENSRKFGQAGIQAQQFFGQLQGGQGFLVAASAQFADLGIVLGAPLVGAIGGIAFSLANILLPALMDGKTGLETVEKAVENVKAAMTLGADGVIEYTAEMKKLKQISEALTEIKLAGLIAEQNEALKVGIKETVDLIDEARDRFALGQLFKDGTKEAIASFVALSESVDALKLDPTAESINKVEQALLGASRAGINSTKQGRKLATQMGGLIAEYKLGKLSIEALQKALIDTDEVIKSSGKTAEKYKNAVRGVQEALAIASREASGMTKEAAELNAEFQAKKILGGDATAEQIAYVVSLLNELAEAQGQIKDRKTAITTTESIISRGETPEDRRNAEMESLQSWHEQMLISDSEFQSARTQLEQEGADARAQIAAMALGSFSNSFGQLAGVLKQSEGEQSNAYKAMFALSKGFAVAQAGVNMALAISEATKLPWPANLPAIATATAQGAQLVSSISGATYSGRENGGSVIGGQTYEVGEKNKPELLMIPGNNGKVFSNSEAKNMMGGGGGGGYQPIINNYMGGTATVEHRRDELTQRDVFDIVQSEMTNPNSKGRRGMQSNSNVHGVLNGRRRS